MSATQSNGSAADQATLNAIELLSAELPKPWMLNFNVSDGAGLIITHRSIGDLLAWQERLQLGRKKMRELNETGDHLITWFQGDWHGCWTSMWVVEPVTPQDRLDLDVAVGGDL